MPTPDYLRAQGSKMENLPKAHGRSTEQNQPLENLRAEKLWRSTEKKSSVPVRQHFIPSNARYPSLSVSLSFIAQGGRPFITRLHHINSLSFRIEILLDVPYRILLPRTRLLYLPIYYTAKGVPMCKGRFTHAIHGLRLGTVFFTTMYSHYPLG